MVEQRAEQPFEPARASLRPGAVDGAVIGERLVAHVEEDERAFAGDLPLAAGDAESLAQPGTRRLAEGVEPLDWSQP